MRVQRFQQNFGFFLGLSIWVLLGGCSPAMFFGSSTDEGVKNAQNHREIEPACANIRLGSSELDVSSFKKLLSCLNAHGGLQPLADLVGKLQDPEIELFLEFNNKYVMSNFKRLYEVEQTYRTLDRRIVSGNKTQLDVTLSQLGKVLENADFVANAISVLKDGYDSNPDQILKTVQYFSQKIHPQNVDSFIKTGLAVASAPSFGAALDHFQGSSRRDVGSLARGFLNYLSQTSQPGHMEPGKTLIRALMVGDLYIPLDELAGKTEGELRHGVPRMNSLLQVTLDRDAEIFRGMTQSFQALNRPIHCLRGSKSVSDPLMVIFNEIDRTHNKDLSSFFQRKNQLSHIALNPFCDFPENLTEPYQSFLKLSETSAVEPAGDMIRSFYRFTKPERNGVIGRPLARLLIDIFAEPAMRELFPIMSEISERAAWQDLLLILALPKIEDRDNLNEALEFIMSTSPALGGKSLYDVMMEVLGKASWQKLAALISSAGNYATPGSPGHSFDPILQPLLESVRATFYANDVHPFADILHDVAANAQQNRKIFELLFKISDMPEFRRTVKLISDMAADGSLKKVVEILSRLFEAFANQGRFPISENYEPPFDPSTLHRHRLSSRTLDALPVTITPANPACMGLNFNLPMDQYLHPGYDRQLTNFLACINSDGKHKDVVDAVQFLRKEKTEKGKPFFHLNIDLIRGLGLDQAKLGFLTDNWLRAFDDGRFFRMLDAVPFWVNTNLKAEDGKSGPVLRPLFDLAVPVIRDARPSLRRLEEYGAQVLKREDFPQQLKFLDEMTLNDFEPKVNFQMGQFNLDRLARWVRNKECEKNKDVGYEFRRATEIEEDYQKSVTTWDLADGNPKREWKFEDFKVTVRPIFEKFSDPAQNNVNKHILDGIVAFNQYYTLKAGEKPNQNQLETPADYARWFHVRSNDAKVITYYYFYPERDPETGRVEYVPEQHPRVRLVNSLDRFELVLFDADVVAKPGSILPLLGNNFALKFLALLGEAWGDEPRELWPPEIRAKYPPGSRPQTLAEAIEEIYKQQGLLELALGFPGDLPKCMQEANPYDPEILRKIELTDPQSGGLSVVLSQLLKLIGVKRVRTLQAHLYNVHQTLSVLAENLPGTGTPHDSGMKFFRNLFFQVYYSTPEEFRDDKAGDKNNLSLITRLARMGFLHHMAKQARRFPAPNDPDLVDFAAAVTHGGGSPEAQYVMHTLFPPCAAGRCDASLELLWKIFETVFSILEEPKTPDYKAKEKWAWDLAYAKQLGFYTLAGAATLVPNEPKNVIAPFLKTLGFVVANERGFLAKHVSHIEELMKSRLISSLMRTLYEDQRTKEKQALAGLLREALSNPHRGLDTVKILKAIDLEPTTQSSWTTFRQRLDVLRSFPEYRALDLGQITRDWLDFFEEKSGSQVSRETAARLRFYLAEKLESGEFDQLLYLARHKPNEFYQVLSTSGISIQNGDLKDFFGLVRRSLSDLRR